MSNLAHPISNPTSITTTPARFESFLALALGIGFTITLAGYSFGTSNHHVYLLDAMRVSDPHLLSRDWFTQSTLQYHLVFTWLTSSLMKLGALKVGFLIGYLLCALVMHASWLGIVRKMGGSVAIYLLSVIFFHASAAGFGLGMFQFLQDGSFLPSNVASVLTLSGIYFWLDRRNALAGFCLGVAGIFHLNYALIAILAWTLLALLDALRDRELSRLFRPKAMLIGLCVMIPCSLNILNAAVSKWNHSARIPLDDFVQFYCYFRHPHHYAPLTWSASLWIAFLWPVPLAWWAFKVAPPTEERKKLGRIFVFVLGLQAFAFFTAGLFFVAETFIQMSLWRFSIFAKLISCVSAAWLLIDYFHVSLRALGVAALGVSVMIVAGLFLPFQADLGGFISSHRLTFYASATLMALIGIYFLLALTRWKLVPLLAGALALGAIVPAAVSGRLGLNPFDDEPPEMMELARWCLKNTDVDALFVVPPSDSAFRLAARRSAVVSFKQVPQLNGELIEWKRRLDDVLGTDVARLRGQMPEMLKKMDDLYRDRSAQELFSLARRYDANYIISLRDLGPDYAPLDEFNSSGGRFRLYRVPHATTSPAQRRS